MMYSFVPKTTDVETHIPGLPFGTPPFNYLRENMIKTLNVKDVEFDLMIQLQTDSHLMPIEACPSTLAGTAFPVYSCCHGSYPETEI